ncbi:MAG: hypothetical protein FJ279_21855, partial [Planctomycetes bacterium]|nr:hypothetical protein [Planctomycetota bacterium]
MNASLPKQRSLSSGVLLALAIGAASMSLEESIAQQLPRPTLKGPAPSPDAPGGHFAPPLADAAISPDAPAIYSFTDDAGPDESFLLVGARLKPELVVWGASATSATGQSWTPKVQFCTGESLAATLPERAFDGPFVVWAKNDAGCSKPLVLNAPQPWWCGPDVTAPGETVRVFGRNLARRPDHVAAFIYVAQPGKRGEWAKVEEAGKYAVRFRIPESFAPGDYEVWAHAGLGGEFGWGGPVKLRITARAAKERPAVALQTVNDDALASALNEATRTGSVVKLPPGTFQLHRTLRIPAGVTVAGAGRDATVLQFSPLQSDQFTKLGGSGWNLAPTAIHTVGDTLEYRLNVPTSGEWTVWLRYATQMAQWGKPGMDGQTALIVNDGEPAPLNALPNTGSFGTYKWSKSASLKLAAGAHRLVWKNLKGGGLSLDAYVFALDPSFQPSDKPFPESSEKVIVLQGEDTVRMQSKEGRLPGGDVPAVWLAGDGASVRDLSILGCPQVNFGIAIRPPRGEVRPYGDSPEKGKWVSGCRVERVRVADVEGKHAENCGIHFLNADHAVVCDNELWARAPLFLAGVRQCDLSRNRLVSVTRFGGNAEAAILGRNSV